MSETHAEMSRTEVFEILERIESITQEIQDRLTRMESNGLVDLVVKQCQYLQAIPESLVDDSVRARMTQLLKSVGVQQQLVEQALAVSDEFNRVLAPHRAYAQKA
ncbi:hypothetical protein [Alicyclobacillus sp. SP_1]|uniref:hypothetical protein n=1 Tax=Alicyclobacillus sp. SP_1 TaxID=2942475 RepID=UPI0021582D25|nr:hypothetical protein [Alicyclobacillus sp. SP_1]